ncbi:MAG: deoxynucleoside kinase [Myxococcota bacterium]|jgi:deoxyadenosine/deoxycytidine kinase|nr:deoxynucleoside kinase [Myxococcota bacterium]
MGKYIAVAGNMGVGKTSLVDFLHRRFNLQPFFEPNEENPFLGSFYQDMPRWAFHSQIYFLTAKYRVHLKLEQVGETVVQDRTLYEDAEVFEKNLYKMGYLDEREHKVYRALYESIAPRIRPPDLMLYLKCPVRGIRQRIKKRGRPEELVVPADYLRRLNDLYEAWFEHYDLSPVVVIDTSKLDYLSDLVDRLDLFGTIERVL